jgi:hypothetical protein
MWEADGDGARAKMRMIVTINAVVMLRRTVVFQEP